MTAQTAFAYDDAITDKYLSRCERYSLDSITEDLDKYGAAVLPGLVSAHECKVMARLFSDAALSHTPPLAEQGTWGNGDHRYFTILCLMQSSACARRSIRD